MADKEQRLLMLVDENPAQIRLTTALIAREGWRTLPVTHAEAALAALETREGMQLAAIIIDQSVPGGDACQLIAELKRMRPGLPILMLATSASPLLAVEAMRAGASDYLIKPVAPDRLLQALRHATEREAPRDELSPLSEKMSGTLDFDTMIGASPQFRDALAKAAKAARGHAPLLIDGERGTGKEMLVRAMIAASPRAKAPFRILNVRSVPAHSMASVLFGHEKNAFPGAFERQIGMLESLDGGTAVFDEVDRFTPEMQEQLAEALGSGRVRPIGAKHAFKVDIRTIATSNIPLADLVAAGSFRADLFEALSGTRVMLPPLRQRQGDIAALSRHFLIRIGQQPGLRELGITDAALKLLGAYDWPGNVRQLQAVLFRAAVFCESDALTVHDFPQLSQIVSGDSGEDGKAAQEGVGVQLYTADGNLRSLDEIEADVIRLAIGHYRGRMTEVARRLGIGRSTLYRKLGDLGIDSAA